MKHEDLVNKAENWLKKTMNCGVVFNDKFRATTKTGEQPDAIGFRNNVSIMIECKSSRADFLADKKKPFRKNPVDGIGDWRFYMCPIGMIKVEDLPKGWGLLYATHERVYKTHGVPANTQLIRNKPFIGNKESQESYMYSALRRMVIRNRFDEVYDGFPKQQL